jgi:hypothetical protein
MVATALLAQCHLAAWTNGGLVVAELVVAVHGARRCPDGGTVKPWVSTLGGRAARA